MNLLPTEPGVYRLPALTLADLRRFIDLRFDTGRGVDGQRTEDGWEVTISPAPGEPDPREANPK